MSPSFVSRPAAGLTAVSALFVPLLLLLLLLLLVVQPSRADFNACSMNIPSNPSLGNINCLPGKFACLADENLGQTSKPLALKQKPNPGFTWSSVPGAAGYTVVMEDPTMKPGATLAIVHWIVQGIPADGAQVMVERFLRDELKSPI
jgi:phosphatidylethanolamine-binding protein (PEBP) family uncharacterized protein